MKSFKKSMLMLIGLFVLVNLSFAKAKEVRVVTLGPSATEIIFAIGAQDQLVARTDLCDYHP